MIWGGHFGIFYTMLLPLSAFAWTVWNHLQWRIQDFPQGGAPTPKSAIIFQIFCRKPQENYWIWTPGGWSRVPGTPLGSANGLNMIMLGFLYSDVQVEQVGTCWGRGLGTVCLYVEGARGGGGEGVSGACLGTTPVNRRAENITFPQLLWRAVTNIM